MRRLFTLAILLGLVWTSPVLGATPAASPRQVRASTPEQSLRQGVELYRAGKTEEALSHLRGFVLRHPDSPLLSEASLYIARIFRDKGQLQEALLYIERIPPERRGAAARLVQGAALVGTGQAERGVALLQEIPTESLTPADRRLRLTALAEGSARTGKPLSALSYLHRALPDATPEETAKILEQAHLLLRDRASEGELAEAAFMFGGTAIGEDARLQQAQRAFAAGNVEKARTLAQGVAQGPVSFPYRQDAVALLQKVKGGGAAERTVGVILPLSGRYAGFGTLVRRGMELALQTHPESSVRFLFTDAEGDAESCAKAVGDLAADPQVHAVVGPLTSAAAMAAAERAQKEKIPLLALSQKEGIPQAGDYVFRLALTAPAQVRALVDYAIGEQGMTTFAVLAPENRLGQEMAELFSREVERRGGKVAIRVGYPENATDFKPQVRQLAGRGQPQVKSKTAPGAGGAEKKEPVTFEALFIPDSADKIVLIAPQLTYYGLEKVELLGTNGWNSPSLPRLGGRHVAGAVFVDGFFSASPEPAVHEFVRLHQEEHGATPSILEAQGFDAAGILLTLLSDPAVRTRDAVRQALSRLKGYSGVTGTTSFDGEGDAQRRLPLLQVRGGEVVQINGPAQTP